MQKILVIDDEPQIIRLLTITLKSQQYQVVAASSAMEGLNQLVLEQPDLVLLDLGLPDTDGQLLLAQIRSFSEIPIIVLSVRNHEKDKVRALDSGANDYLEKPFGIKELLARIRVVLRTNAKVSNGSSIYDDGCLRIDYAAHKVFVDGERIKFSPREFDLLVEFSRYSGRILTYQYLLKKFWGATHLEDSHYLRIFIRQIRMKLGDDPARPRFIETEPGVGYRFLGESQVERLEYHARSERTD